MSPSEGGDKLTFEIEAADSATEIFVIDGNLNLVDRGSGKLTTKPLDRGIYKVKTKVGFQTQEQYFVLSSPGQRVVLAPLAFSSAAPLTNTSTTHNYQMEAAELQSRNTHVRAGAGSSIFIFSREWTLPGVDASRDKPDPPVNPASGLSLRDLDDTVLASIPAAGIADLTVPDAWAACTVQVTPGIYLLSLELPSGRRAEQSVVASPGWQTQVFLLQREYEGPRRADLSSAAILMRRRMGYDCDDAAMRQTELARLGLTSRSHVLSDEVRQMLQGKFEDPMLGIFGGHLLLLESSPDLSLLTTVVDNLRWLLQSPHPDVEALALKLGGAHDYVFEIPPMLRRSWRLVLDATVSAPNLVPEHSLASNVAQNLWSEEPWHVWETVRSQIRASVNAVQEPAVLGAESPAPAPPAAIHSLLETALMSYFTGLPTTVKRAESAFEAVRKMRASKPEAGLESPAVDTEAKPAEIATSEPKLPDDPAMELLVKIFRVPRCTIESALKVIGRAADFTP